MIFQVFSTLVFLFTLTVSDRPASKVYRQSAGFGFAPQALFRNFHGGAGCGNATLISDGPFQVESGGTLIIQLGYPPCCGQVIVYGPATLLSGSQLAFDVDYAALDHRPYGSRWHFLYASGGITGTFTLVTVLPPGWQVEYTSNDIYLSKM